MSISNLQVIQELLEEKNEALIPYLSVQDLQEQLSENKTLILLDTREKNEFDISHLPNAIHIGYENFDLESFKKQYSKNSKIILYCSLGIRSERIGTQLHKAGFKTLQNLHGGIFQWADQGFQLIDSLGLSTQKVHVYNSKWRQYLFKAQAVL